MDERATRPKKIAFFGHFDSSNFGNESTLRAILHHLRRFQPDAEVVCISTGPDAVAATYHIKAIPIADRFFASWRPRNPLSRVFRRICIALPTETYQWVKGLISLRGTDMLVVPGTGLLTDANGLLRWGPYSLLRWSLIAKVCRCKLLLVSVGAGPIYSLLGRWFVKLILSLADFRSYRDDSTMQYLAGIGFRRENDRVYPDLAFSLPEAVVQHQETETSPRSVIGLGVMDYAGKYSVANPSDAIYFGYLENLAAFAKWLLTHEYNIRLLSGDLGDMRAKQEFTDLLRKRLSGHSEEYIIDEPICSVEDVLSQIVATDFVVATRFHNILLALLCGKPVISISFHHKCESLMRAMGLSQYCVNINNFKADQLVKIFCDLKKNYSEIKSAINERSEEFRRELNEQYEIIFNEMLDA